MTPERDASLGALVKVLSVPLKVFESARRVEEAAVVMVEESVVPLYERPVPMRRVCIAPVPLPLRIPERVDEPVPPSAVVRVDVAERVFVLEKYGSVLAAPVYSEEVAIVRLLVPRVTSVPESPRPSVAVEVAWVLRVPLFP